MTASVLSAYLCYSRLVVTSTFRFRNLRMHPVYSTRGSPSCRICISLTRIGIWYHLSVLAGLTNKSHWVGNVFFDQLKALLVVPTTDWCHIGVEKYIAFAECIKPNDMQGPILNPGAIAVLHLIHGAERGQCIHIQQGRRVGPVDATLPIFALLICPHRTLRPDDRPPPAHCQQG